MSEAVWRKRHSSWLPLIALELHTLRLLRQTLKGIEAPHRPVLNFQLRKPLKPKFEARPRVDTKRV